MTTLTVQVDECLKRGVQTKAKKEGFTLTALIAQFFKSYLNDECTLTLKMKNEIIESHEELMKDIKSGKANIFDSPKELLDNILNEEGEV